jgi:hypothetical protein
LTLAQAKKLGDAEWPLWLEAVRKELSSLIIENEAFNVVEYVGCSNGEAKQSIRLVGITQA